MRVKSFLLWGFLVISWFRGVYGGKCFESVCAFEASAALMERKCRAALVFSDFFQENL